MECRVLLYPGCSQTIKHDLSSINIVCIYIFIQPGSTSCFRGVSCIRNVCYFNDKSFGELYL